MRTCVEGNLALRETSPKVKKVAGHFNYEIIRNTANLRRLTGKC